MTPEAQRIIAIAEACGWLGVHTRDYEMVGKRNRDSELCVVPDYLNDLNAMHEAEKVLNEKQLDVMRDYLSDIYARDYPERDTIRVWRCTAAQRAEAFLRTLELWKDSSVNRKGR